MAVPSGLRIRLGDEAGIGLVEVIMAIFILAVALLALGSVSITSLASLRDTRDREQATNAASAAIEDIRSRDFRDIVHATGDVDPSKLPPGANPSVATTSCFDMTGAGERIVYDTAGTPVPFERTAGDGGHITVHTIITYEGADCAGSERSPLKRITVIASWNDGPNSSVVIQETQVTAVARGLPVPRFEIRPEEATVRFSEEFLTDPAEPDRRRCVEHILLNLGAEDGYDWAVEPVDPSELVVEQPVHHAFDVGGWRVTAFFELSEDAPLREGQPPAVDDEARFEFEPGVARPVSDLRVEPRESALLTVCYEPATLDAVPDPADVRLVLRSRFDERQEREVTNLVRVGSDTNDPSGVPGDPLFLFEDVDDERHPRTMAPGIMAPLADADAPATVVERLSTHDYSPEFADWSTDVGSEDLSGVRLLPTATPSADPPINAHTAAWHYQFGSSTTLQRDATLVLWLAPPQALTGALDTEGAPLAVQLTFNELRSNETPVNNGWVVNIDHQYQHTTLSSASTGGWQRVEIPVDLLQDRSFNNNRYLRMRITCIAPSSGTPQDCNLAYDNVNFPSALYVQER